MTAEQLKGFWEEHNRRLNTIIGKATVPAMRSGDPLAKEVHQDLLEFSIWVGRTTGREFRMTKSEILKTLSGQSTHYCPACGTYSYTEFQIVKPGDSQWQCPECKTLFRISVQFFEVESKGGSDDHGEG